MKDKNNKKGIVAIDLFAGAGGLSRGLQDSGIKVLAGIDFDDSARKSYEYNNEAIFIKQNIKELKGKDILSLLKGYENYYFLLCGCAPCQAFSTRNAKQKTVDERRSLLLEFERLIKETNPDFVFMENVPGIKKREPHVFKSFVDTLEKKEYSFSSDIVNTKYFEVPQERKRFVLFASKHNNIELPKYIIRDDNFLTVRHTIEALPTILAGEEHEDIYNHKSINLIDLNIIRLKQTPHNGGSRSDWKDKGLITPCHRGIKGFGNSYGRLAWDLPAPTITTRFYTYSSGRHGHPEQNRAMSFKEGALLQTFPNNYLFFGTNSEIGRQIGNAVPPRMAYHFGKHFLEHLN